METTLIQRIDKAIERADQLQQLANTLRHDLETWVTILRQHEKQGSSLSGGNYSRGLFYGKPGHTASASNSAGPANATR
jgi:hypothetical protein